jgi:hypothetical protein
MKLIVLASQPLDSVVSQTTVQITPELIFDDVAAVTRKILHQNHAFKAMFDEDNELTVARITEASHGSFLWAKLTAKRVRDEHLPHETALSTSMEGIVRAEYTITDLVAHTLQSKARRGREEGVGLAGHRRPPAHTAGIGGSSHHPTRQGRRRSSPRRGLSSFTETSRLAHLFPE